MLTPPRVEPSPPNTRPSEGSSDLVSVIQQRWSAIPSRAPTISDENIIFLSKVAQAVRENNPGELPWHRLSE